MKKFRSLFVVLAVVMLLGCFCYGCAKTFSVTFDYNYDGAPQAVVVTLNDGEKVTKPADPTREGYTFGGWTTDKSGTQAYSFDTAVTADITLYAKWSQPLSVSFDLNYTDSAQMQPVTVSKGDKVTKPADPARENYDFGGWFTDSNCTKEYVFDTAVNEPLTLYAKWTPAAGMIVYTYMYNYTGAEVYREEVVNEGFRVSKPTDPVRDGYYFRGWFTDAAGTEEYDFFNERVTGPKTLYAKWFNIYTFEAEHTNLEGKRGQGMSDNVIGTQLIMGEKDFENGKEMGISGGFLISRLLYRGAFLEFDITAAEAVDDAVLAFRFTPDMFDMIFEDDELLFEVNGENVACNPLIMTGAYKSDGPINGERNKRPFANYIINANISLNQGSNKVKLIVNNNNAHGGTFAAECPLVDCMYIYSDIDISWTAPYPYTSNTAGK